MASVVFEGKSLYFRVRVETDLQQRRPLPSRRSKISSFPLGLHSGMQLMYVSEQSSELNGDTESELEPVTDRGPGTGRVRGHGVWKGVWGSRGCFQWAVRDSLGGSVCSATATNLP